MSNMATTQTRLSVSFLLFVYSSFAMPETHIAAPLTTTAPALNAQGVEKRALGDQTCGYVNGDPNSPLVCPGTASCTFTNYYWGCCNALSCDAPATCELDSTPYCAGVAFDNCVYPQIRRCSDACVTYIRNTKVGGLNPTYSWTCGPSDTTYLVLATTTGGDSTSMSITSATEAATGSSSLSSATETISTSTSTSSSTSPSPSTSSSASTFAGDAPTSISTTLSSPTIPLTGTAATSNETASPSPTSTHHALTPGKIAGIAIGSIGGALIIGGIIYLILKNYAFVRRSPDDTRRISGYASGGTPKPISNSGFEMSDRMSGVNGAEFHDDRTWDGPAVEVRSQTSTVWSQR